MARGRQVNKTLAAVERLLLAPDPRAMQEVERQLAGLIDGIRETGTTTFEPEVRASVLNIKSLLDSARQFWSYRRPTRAPSLQYSAHGALVENLSECTFMLEV